LGKEAGLKIRMTHGDGKVVSNDVSLRADKIPLDASAAKLELLES
jgi:hypothetical protein